MPSVPIVTRTVVPQVQGVKWNAVDDGINEGRLVFVDMANNTYEFELTSDEKRVVLKELAGGVELSAAIPIELQGVGGLRER